MLPGTFSVRRSPITTLSHRNNIGRPLLRPPGGSRSASGRARAAHTCTPHLTTRTGSHEPEVLTRHHETNFVEYLVCHTPEKLYQNRGKSKL